MAEIIYIAHATATGGRDGHVETNDGALKLILAVPGTAAAKPGTTNPEQLFACAYAACFGSALTFVAQRQKIKLTNPEVHADIALNKNSDGFFVGVTLQVDLPGIENSLAEKLVHEAHQLCPYSKATRGNIEVLFKVNDLSLSAAA